MNIIAPVRRLAPRCLSYRPKVIAAHMQSRAASSDVPKPNKFLEELQKKQADIAAAGGTISEAEAKLQQQRAFMERGDISAGSIFDDGKTSGRGQVQQQDVEADDYDILGAALATDPRPKSRIRWERRKVMKLVRNGGRMTRPEMLARTEREHLAKSQNMKTSVKKLGMLARQIAGKPLEEAIMQMDFSKKQAAKYVLAHLRRAKHEAVVAGGLGLGQTKNEIGEESDKTAEPLQIRLKNRKKHTVTDPTSLYIDQAWVGRGPYGKLPDYRARGRMFIMRTPWTSLTVVLKEEATRVREYIEREAKDKKKRLANVWKHLPDRPLQGPRGQYYSW